jgi:hypothetical protein
MSPEDCGQARTDGRPEWRLAGHGWVRVRRFTEEDAARMLRSNSRTDARDWAVDLGNDHPMLSDAFGHGLRSTRGAATLLKGTVAIAARHVRGTLGGHP